MTGAQVLAAANGNPAIESFEDVQGRGMRLRYIGFRHIAADFRIVMDADAASARADRARIMAEVERVDREIGASPLRFAGSTSTPGTLGGMSIAARYRRRWRWLLPCFAVVMAPYLGNELAAVFFVVSLLPRCLYWSE